MMNRYERAFSVNNDNQHIKLIIQIMPIVQYCFKTLDHASSLGHASLLLMQLGLRLISHVHGFYFLFSDYR